MNSTIHEFDQHEYHSLHSHTILVNVALSQSISHTLSTMGQEKIN